VDDSLVEFEGEWDLVRKEADGYLQTYPYEYTDYYDESCVYTTTYEFDLIDGMGELHTNVEATCTDDWNAILDVEFAAAQAPGTIRVQLWNEDGSPWSIFNCVLTDGDDGLVCATSGRSHWFFERSSN
jgi:hypothetical protein